MFVTTIDVSKIPGRKC